MSSDFNENTRVQVPAALHLCKLGYTYLDNIKIYDTKTNILTDIFLSQLQKLNPSLSETDCKNFFNKIITCLNNDDLGKEFYSLVSANSGIHLIDFDNAENNVWHVTTEFTCENEETKDSFRPDITCFVNGLPLAFIEVKKPNNSEGMLSEFERTNARFRNKSFRRFFNITQLMIYSNNQKYDNENRVPIQGAFYCCTAKEKAFYNVFREEINDFAKNYDYLQISNEIIKKVCKHRNCISLPHHPEFETNCKPDSWTNRIITSMLSKERFLFLLRYGFTYVNRKKELDEGEIVTELQKHIMRYQQFFASLAIRKKLEAGIKSGIIWHTQGSGKTALAYYSVKSLTDFFAAKNTATKFYFIVDRIALMEQAIDEFSSRGLSVRSASSREEFMKDIKDNRLVSNNNGELEIMVVNIQKFEEDHTPVKIEDTYSTNLQRIFFIDEAHRGYNPQGSFLANLLESDKNAIKIAMTGTPLLKEERESWRVFGDYINTYYYDKSIADGYTLKIMREPIETIYREKLEKILDTLTGSVEVKKRDIDKDKIIENETYLNALIDYIIADIRKFRIAEADETVAAMVVCKTNTQARKFYELWEKRYDLVKMYQDLKQSGNYDPMTAPKIQKPLIANLILHDEGDKEERKFKIDEFKKKETIDVLVVNQMLLTGFDAPRLKKLYLGRKLDGHDLLQALTRVNRPYKDFKYGYVVDFVDIKENFDTTNERYLKELNRTNDSTQTGETLTPAQAILVSEDEINEKIQKIKSVLWYYDVSNQEEFRIQLDETEDKNKLYELRSTLEEAKALVNRIRSSCDEELSEKVRNLLPSTIPSLITEVTHRIERINLFEGNEHKDEVSAIINLALSSLSFEFKKGVPEELQICINDLRDRYERVHQEFEANFDKTEEKYVILADEFRSFFRKKGFVPQSVKDAKDDIHYMDEVMKKIKEINSRNNLLRKKYHNDERFARIHKRIQEENKKRPQVIISNEDMILCESLYQMKCAIDTSVDLNPHILEGDSQNKFKQDVLSDVSKKLSELKIKVEIGDKKYIANLISNEYINQYNSYGRSS